LSESKFYAGGRVWAGFGDRVCDCRNDVTPKMRRWDTGYRGPPLEQEAWDLRMLVETREKEHPAHFGGALGI
jgi:hypothetical protein